MKLNFLLFFVQYIKIVNLVARGPVVDPARGLGLAPAASGRAPAVASQGPDPAVANQGKG